MSLDQSTLIVEILKRMQADVSDIKRDVGDMKFRIHVLEDQTASTVMALAGVNHRLDRMQDDMTSVKRRLDLVDAD
jgi:predicted  nucleic acid-binding Zn-ribbon protein